MKNMDKVVKIAKGTKTLVSSLCSGSLESAQERTGFLSTGDIPNLIDAVTNADIPKLAQNAFTLAGLAGGYYLGPAVGTGLGFMLGGETGATVGFFFGRFGGAAAGAVGGCRLGKWVADYLEKNDRSFQAQRGSCIRIAPW